MTPAGFEKEFDSEENNNCYQNNSGSKKESVFGQWPRKQMKDNNLVAQDTMSFVSALTKGSSTVNPRAALKIEQYLSKQ